MLVDRTGEKLFCTGCQAAGSKSGDAGGVHLKSCDKCGFPFCMHCGKEDKFSNQFMCNNCWRERGEFLVNKGRLNDAIVIFERLGDFDSIKDIVKMREGTSFRGRERRIHVKRVLMVQDGKLVLGSQFQGKTISDILISRMTKTSLVQEVGWELAPIFRHIFDVFSRMNIVTGDFILDLENNNVTYSKGTATRTSRRHIILERLKVHSSKGTAMATRMDGEIILDNVFTVIPKRILVEELGWEKVSLLLGIIKEVKKIGVYVIDRKTGRIIEID